MYLFGYPATRNWNYHYRTQLCNLLQKIWNITLYPFSSLLSSQLISSPRFTELRFQFVLLRMEAGWLIPHCVAEWFLKWLDLIVFYNSIIIGCFFFAWIGVEFDSQDSLDNLGQMTIRAQIFLTGQILFTVSFLVRVSVDRDILHCNLASLGNG